MNRTIAIVAAALFASVAVTLSGQTRFVINSDDTPAEVRRKVLTWSQAHFEEPGMGMDQVESFVQGIQQVNASLEARYAEVIGRYVGDAARSPGFLAQGDAQELVDAFRMLYLVRTAEREAISELVRVAAAYDHSISIVEAKTADLEGVLQRLQEANAMTDRIVQTATGNARAAQETTATLAGVLETYRTIIETQQEILSGGRATPSDDRVRFSLLGGAQWNAGAGSGSDAGLEDFSGLVGTLVTWPIFKQMELGVGFTTTFPPGSTGVVVQVGMGR